MNLEIACLRKSLGLDEVMWADFQFPVTSVLISRGRDSRVLTNRKAVQGHFSKVLSPSQEDFSQNPALPIP